MRIVQFGVVSLALLFVLGASSAEAQNNMRPYNLTHKKPLPVGARVWVNIGDDTHCTYTRKGPLATDRCFRKVYHKAIVVDILKLQIYGGPQTYVYRVSFKFFKSGMKAYNAPFDSLYEVPSRSRPKSAAYSPYFLALNW